MPGNLGKCGGECKCGTSGECGKGDRPAFAPIILRESHTISGIWLMNILLAHSPPSSCIGIRNLGNAVKARQVRYGKCAAARHGISITAHYTAQCIIRALI